jgi:hypothetical protein
MRLEILCLASPLTADHTRHVDGYLMTPSEMQTAGCFLKYDPKVSCHDIYEILGFECYALSGAGLRAEMVIGDLADISSGLPRG